MLPLLAFEEVPLSVPYLMSGCSTPMLLQIVNLSSLRLAYISTSYCERSELSGLFNGTDFYIIASEANFLVSSMARIFLYIS